MFTKIDIDDIKGFRIGNAENAEAGTGCTVVIAESGATAGVSVRGGSPATRETELLRSENTVDKIQAVVLSGGSAFGLEAGSGVMRELEDMSIGHQFGNIRVPIVCQASLFDLNVGDSTVRPDRAMGVRAVHNAYNGAPLRHGNYGAGTGASVGKYYGINRAMKSGLGAFACSDGEIQVGAIAAVNAFADVYDGNNNLIAGLLSADRKRIDGTIRPLKNNISIHPAHVESIRVNPIFKPKANPYNSDVAKDAVNPDENSGVDSEKTVGLSLSNADSETAETTVLSPSSPESTFAESVESIGTATEHVAEQPEETELFKTTQETPAEYSVKTTSEVITDNVIERPLKMDLNEDSSLPADEIQIETGAVSEQLASDYDITLPSEIEFEDDDEEPISPENMGYDITFNTTISCLITNAKLTKTQCNQLASILHDGYARAIKPVHTTVDGDTIFVMTTGEKPVNFDAFAALATDILQFSVIDGVISATSAYGLPAASEFLKK